MEKIETSITINEFKSRIARLKTLIWASLLIFVVALLMSFYVFGIFGTLVILIVIIGVLLVELTNIKQQGIYRDALWSKIKLLEGR